MAIEKGAGELNHIEFQREPDHQPERRRRSPFGQAPPRPTSRAAHALAVSAETSNARGAITASRQIAGVDPSMLLVLEFDSVTLDLRNQLEERFDAVVVDEQRTKSGDHNEFRYVVQFRNQDTLDRFQEEVIHYQNDNQDTVLLPHGGRQNFFDALQHTRAVSSDERRGKRLVSEGVPNAEQFYLDVDLWYPGNYEAAQFVRRQIRAVCENHRGQWRDAVQTRSLILGKVRADPTLLEMLLSLDLVARVDLPPQLTDAYLGLRRDATPPDPGRMPDDEDGLATVIDSGVLAGHPMLSNWVIDERDFDSGEGTPADLNGHGTSVAGLIVFGDVASCIEADRWIPRVRICNAKVLQHDPDFNHVTFPEENRVEEVIENAIRHFQKERGCRVFNLSIGIARDVYEGGRQFPLAEKIDELSRELDVVIVVSAGNRGDLPIPEGTTTREELQQAIRDQMLQDRLHRLCNPATASLALTVGSIARSDAVAANVTMVPGAPAGAPSPFSRVGPGYAATETAMAVKPEVVAFGGNMGVQTIAGDDPRWVDNLWLGEPTIRPEKDGRILTGQRGTSFAAPHVTHAAACVERNLHQSLGRTPSANAIRAVLGTALCPTDFLLEWIASDDQRLSAYGYGVLGLNRALWSIEQDACLLSEDRVEEDRLHIYRIGVPNDFIDKVGRRSVTVALAYDPPVRASRRDYLARTINVDLVHGLTESDVEKYRGHQPGDKPPSLPAKNDLKALPARTKLERSTLQVRRKSWKTRPKLKANGDGGSPIIHVIVSCQRRFPTGEDPHQTYALAIRFWHENDAAQIHTQIRTRVRTATRVRI